MNELAERVFAPAPRRSPVRPALRFLRRRWRLIAATVALATAFAGGVLSERLRSDGLPRPVGAARATDPAGDVFTEHKDFPPIGRVGDGLDLRSVAMTSDGRVLVLSITTAGRPVPTSAAVSAAFRFTFQRGDRPLYTARITISREGSARLSLDDRDFQDSVIDSARAYARAHCPGLSEREFWSCDDLVKRSKIGSAMILREESVSIRGNSILIRLDLSSLPKLLFGMSWVVNADGFLPQGHSMVPYSDRLPDTGSRTFPAP